MSRERVLSLASLCIFGLNGANHFQCAIFTLLCWGSKHCMKQTLLSGSSGAASELPQRYNTSLPPSITCPSDDSARHHLTSMYTEL